MIPSPERAVVLRTVLLIVLNVFLFSFSAGAKTEVFGGTRSKVSAIDLSVAGSAWEYRRTHRVGFGMVAGGSYGIAGGMLELNLSPRWSAGIGVGRGDPFQSVVASVKRFSNLWDSSWLPYFGAHFARWENFGSTEPIQSTAPSFLAESFLSEADRARGRVRSSLLNPVLGLQYIQLHGDWRGFLIALELGAMVHLTGNGTVPSGAFQFGYVF